MDRAFFTSSRQLSRRWMQIYERDFPFVVRYHLDEWIRELAWEDIKDNDEFCKDAYNSLMKVLERKIKDLEDNGLDQMQLISAKEDLEKTFEAFPSDLVGNIYRCLRRERLLAESAKPDDERRHTPEDEQMLEYQQKEEKILNIVADLGRRSQQLENKMGQLHVLKETTLSKKNDYQGATTPAEQKQIENIVTQCKSVLTSRLQDLVYELEHECHNVARVLQDSWDLIHLYKQQQKDSVCFRSKPPEGAVDCLDKVCEGSSRQLKAYLVHVEKVLADISGSPFETQNPLKDRLETLAQAMYKLLRRHLDEIFVITRQPQNVLKIVQKKSPRISLCVRLLGGRGLGLEHNLPTVTVNAYAEKDLQRALQAPDLSLPGVCEEVENGQQSMELDRSSGHIKAELNNVRLMGVKPLAKAGKEDRIPQQKYGIIFSTCVTINNQKHDLKALSLLIILTTQTSQEGPAKGTLLWDAAFSIPNRLIYEERKTVLWWEMEQVLRDMFSETGRDLDQAQLNYIGNLIFNNGEVQVGCEPDFSQHELTKRRFLYDNIPRRKFTFWMWLYACRNLVVERVKTEWQNKLIHGFIGRQGAEDLLTGKPPGTFLLRFRERSIDDDQKARSCANLALAVVSTDGTNCVFHIKDCLTQEDIGKSTLTGILDSMIDPVLSTLYPDRSFQELVEQHLPRKSKVHGEMSIGYKRTKRQVRVDREDFGANCSVMPASLVTSPIGASPRDDIPAILAFSVSDNEEMPELEPPPLSVSTGHENPSVPLTVSEFPDDLLGCNPTIL